MADQQDDFESENDGTENTSDGADSGSQSSGAADGSGTTQGNSGDSDSLRRLQSERDKETARANKAEKQLATLQKQATSANDGNATEVPPQVQQWITAAQQNAREALYKADGRLERYGVDPSLIRGDTPVEMQASAKALGDAMDKMERDIRDSVLQEHGFTPAPRDASSMGTKNFRTMDSKEFQALVDEALRG